MSRTRLTSNMMDTQIHSGMKYNPATTTGLTFGLTAGYNPDRSFENQVAAGTVALTDDDTNYVYVNGTVLGVTVAATIPGSAQYLYEVVTSAGVITTITDIRATYE